MTFRKAVIISFAALIVTVSAILSLVLSVDNAGDIRRVDRRVVKQVGSACVRRDDEAECRKLARRLLPYLVDLSRGTPRLRDTALFAPRGGGAPGSPQQGGGPTGRVPPRGGPPPPSQPPPSGSPPAREPTVDLDVPVVPRVCVGELVGVNCKP